MNRDTERQSPHEHEPSRAKPPASATRCTGPLAVAVKILAALLLVLIGTVLSIPGVPGPGFVFYLGAFAIVLSLSPRLRKRFIRFKRRHPRLAAAIDRARKELRKRRRKRAANRKRLEGGEKVDTNDPRP